MADYEQSLTTSIYNLKYDNADKVTSDVLSALTEYIDLGHKEELFVYEDGYKKKLLKLEGTIPVFSEGSVFNIPVSIWLSKRHPFRAPMVFVTPSSRMHVMSGNFVDMNGKVNLPYLADWNYPSSDLLSLIQILTTVFTEELPVRSKSLPRSTDKLGIPTSTSIPIRDLEEYKDQENHGLASNELLDERQMATECTGAAGKVHGINRPTTEGRSSLQLTDEVHGRQVGSPAKPTDGINRPPREGRSSLELTDEVHGRQVGSTARPKDGKDKCT